MFGVTTSDEYRPVTWMGRYPVDVTTLLVAVQVVCVILVAIITGFLNPLLVDLLTFDSTQVLRAGHVWTLFTYAFVHPPTQLLWFAVHLYFFFFFGREVERYLGRRGFIGLFLSLLLAPPLLFCIWGFNQRIIYYDSLALDFAVYATFSLIYPNVRVFFGIVVKWFAIALGGILTLQFIAANSWTNLAALWVSIAVAYIYLRLYLSETNIWSKLNPLRSKPKIYVVQKPTSRRVVEPEDISSSIDPILDKISRSGIGSLTDSEKRQLDRARKQLLKKSE